ncbi:hypothetical protein [Yersinia enterocolitica]|uniref:hypothetical protein n=1 Tax=Yersinia enterocolitica TaxID=630 RepID=UPI00067AA51F|nr:hypothetical protein [Yersinia enterocolitica]HDL8466110.1 hypothetical protein [Yersinia enterocolitica]HDL8491770.1 hypothetical protein [Yersinia enterocolitica]HDO7714573.1 hypothetical protein [Yersinia enterocolitica]
MKADPEGIVRVTQWGSPYEEGGNFNWQAIITELSDLADPNHVFLAFQQTAQKLIGLKSRLKARGYLKAFLVCREWLLIIWMKNYSDGHSYEN